MECRNILVGDIVLVQNAKSFRGHWKLAGVCSAVPSKDGKVRDVELRYKSLTDGKSYDGSKDLCIKRSAHRLVLVVPAEDRPI